MSGSLRPGDFETETVMEAVDRENRVKVAAGEDEGVLESEIDG